MYEFNEFSNSTFAVQNGQTGLDVLGQRVDPLLQLTVYDF